MRSTGCADLQLAFLLNCWLLIAIALPSDPPQPRPYQRHRAGAGLADRVGADHRLDRHRVAGPRHTAAAARPRRRSRSTKPVPAVILFALIRAIATAIAVAIAFGFHLPDADWMPIACLIAMKSSLAQSTDHRDAAAGRGDHRRRGGGAVPADRGHQDHPGSAHRHPGHPGRVHPRIVHPVLRRWAGVMLIAEDLPHPHQPRPRGAPGVLTLASMRIATPAHQTHRQSDTFGACSTCSMKARPMSSPASAGAVMTGERYQPGQAQAPDRRPCCAAC